jgi:transcriptional regulator with XRE-family HTH domain/quercetin dioxygenase-like cupin family protein
MSDSDLEYVRLIGEKLRGARQQRRMSLRELAGRANMSASMLSQIETGKAYPSVRSIYNIASALDLPIDYFFPEQNGTLSPRPEVTFADGEMTASEMREATMVRSGEVALSEQTLSETVAVKILHAGARPTIQLKGGVTWSRLTADPESDAEFLEITYTQGATSGVEMSYHEGREFGLILEGELVVELGFEQVTLRVGDSIVFESSTPHRLTNKSSQPMRALWVVWKGLDGNLQWGT